MDGSGVEEGEEKITGLVMRYERVFSKFPPGFQQG